jgi:SAM-dependent MidA family methyltransferase
MHRFCYQSSFASKHLNTIINTIKQEIAIHGVLPFCRFMQLALYHPNLGYYETRQTTIGKNGDFFTSVSVGNLFGTLLGRQFCDWLSPLPTSHVQIIEAGAHEGRLAVDILAYLSTCKELANKKIDYCILDPSPQRQAWQKKVISSFGYEVKWLESWDQCETQTVDGIIFSNELLDAFPSHRIRWDASLKAWFEWGVAIVDEKLTWARMAHTRDTAAAMIEEENRACGFELSKEFLAALPDGFSVDLCPDARQWWSQAARKLRRGYLMAIDYGLEVEQFYEPQRAHGTLRGYRNHQIQPDVLANPGEQDITTTVNFTAIKRAGEKEGLQTVAYQSQSRFLTSILANHAEEFEPAFSKNPVLASQFKTLIHPDHLGRAFQVSVQRTPMV